VHCSNKPKDLHGLHALLPLSLSPHPHAPPHSARQPAHPPFSKFLTFLEVRVMRMWWMDAAPSSTPTLLARDGFVAICKCASVFSCCWSVRWGEGGSSGSLEDLASKLTAGEKTHFWGSTKSAAFEYESSNTLSRPINCEGWGTQIFGSNYFCTFVPFCYRLRI